MRERVCWEDILVLGDQRVEGEVCLFLTANIIQFYTEIEWFIDSEIQSQEKIENR
jgi:hypothetical protein